MEALRRTGGWSLLLSVLPFTVYPLFAEASWLGPFRGTQSTLEQATAYHVLSGESLLGIPIQAFADTVIGFLVFGTALMMTGAGKFFINIAFALCGTFRGGAAKVCIFASGLLGMMSGSDRLQRADRRHHDHPRHEEERFSRLLRRRHRGLRLDRRGAGAAGDGRDRLRHRAVPQHQLRRGRARRHHSGGALLCRPVHAGRRLRRPPRPEGPAARRAAERMDTIKEGWYYIFVIALLIVMLLHFKRESHAPFYATALLLVLNQLFSKDTRWTLATIVEFLEVNGRTFVELVGILAGCGLLIGAFSMTGVVSSLANDLLRIAGDNAFLLLVMCAITSLVLGPRADHDRLLHLPRHPGGAGAGEARAQQDGRAHVHLLLGHAVVDHAAGRDRLLRRGRHRRRAGDEDRLGEHVGRQHHLFHPVLLRAEPRAGAAGRQAPISPASG